MSRDHDLFAQWISVTPRMPERLREFGLRLVAQDRARAASPVLLTPVSPQRWSLQRGAEPPVPLPVEGPRERQREAAVRFLAISLADGRELNYVSGEPVPRDAFPPSVNALRNAVRKPALLRQLERLGFPEVANELRAVHLEGDGAIRFKPSGRVIVP